MSLDATLAVTHPGLPIPRFPRETDAGFKVFFLFSSYAKQRTSRSPRLAMLCYCSLSHHCSHEKFFNENKQLLAMHFLLPWKTPCHARWDVKLKVSPTHFSQTGFPQRHAPWRCLPTPKHHLIGATTLLWHTLRRRQNVNRCGWWNAMDFLWQCPAHEAKLSFFGRVWLSSPIELSVSKCRTYIIRHFM
jgi:hypothetical protein